MSSKPIAVIGGGEYVCDDCGSELRTLKGSQLIPANDRSRYRCPDCLRYLKIQKEIEEEVLPEVCKHGVDLDSECWACTLPHNEPKRSNHASAVAMDFDRNTISYLAEERLAMGVMKPEAFVNVNVVP
jgi:DNA-directed RNA polymerase subunit RPC12/RpoP